MSPTTNHEPVLYSRILVSLAADPHASKLLEVAASLAQAGHTQIHVLHVRPPASRQVAWADRPVPIEEIEVPLERAAHDWLLGICRGSAFPDCIPECVMHDTPWRAILERAESHGADLIVMGSHGRNALQSILLGSVSQRVLAHASVPVLIVP